MYLDLVDEVERRVLVVLLLGHRHLRDFALPARRQSGVSLSAACSSRPYCFITEALRAMVAVGASVDVLVCYP